MHFFHLYSTLFFFASSMVQPALWGKENHGLAESQDRVRGEGIFVSAGTPSPFSFPYRRENSGKRETPNAQIFISSQLDAPAHPQLRNRILSNVKKKTLVSFLHTLFLFLWCNALARRYDLHISFFPLFSLLFSRFYPPRQIEIHENTEQLHRWRN